MRKQGKNPNSARGQRERPAKRSWPVAVSMSVVIVGLGIVISTTVNALLGRAVHWDWMAGLAPMLLVVLTLVLRNRWA